MLAMPGDALAYDKLRLIDFGQSTALGPEEVANEKVGSVYYMAPEIINRGISTHQSDIWACGVVCYMLLSARPPFNGENEEEILKRAREGHVAFMAPIFKEISSSAKDFIRQLMTLNVSKRPTALEALQHPFMLDVHKQLPPEQMAEAFANMESFRFQNLFKHATYAFLVAQCITLAEKANVDRAFRVLDADGDGVLS